MRVNGRRVETCPISGTIKRGDDAIADCEQILKLLNSKKDESELTMCSDVDRNDKSRVCEPGSVRVIGRRQIEMYSRLIHTVDHIEGRLREGMDAFDGFLSAMPGRSPSPARRSCGRCASSSRHEKSPRAWYGGAIGMVRFQRRHEHRPDAAHHPHQGRHCRGARRRDVALRFHSRRGRSRNRTEGLRHDLRHPRRQGRQFRQHRARRRRASAKGVNILLVDHEDCFVHTLANYFRQTGANVSTVRTPVPDEVFDRLKPDLVVLSPGPGTPKDFDCAATIKKARARDLPIFGVCLGLQALAEAYGGELRQLHVPMHGKPSRIRVLEAGRHLLRPAQGSHRRPLSLDLRRSGAPARRFHRHGGNRGRRRSWPSSTARSRSPPCSSIRNRS